MPTASEIRPALELRLAERLLAFEVPGPAAALRSSAPASQQRGCDGVVYRRKAGPIRVENFPSDLAILSLIHGGKVDLHYLSCGRTLGCTTHSAPVLAPVEREAEAA